MDWILRELSGSLLPKPGEVSDDDLQCINSLPNPPLVPLTVDDIYVRQCRLAGDAIDAGFGRFRSDDLNRLLELTQGAPALIGHNKSSLGVARFFGGDIWEDPDTGIKYARLKFYWMRNHSESENLRVNIDGGIYTEASIGFTFGLPTCGICGEDVRRCDHKPGKEYEGERCFYYYDDIQRVTEGSFVYRGAQPGTGFSLSADMGSDQGWQTAPRFKWGGVWYRGYPEKQKI